MVHRTLRSSNLTDFLTYLRLFLFSPFLLDEIKMDFPFLINLGVKDRFLGDLNQYNIEPIHH